MAAHCGLTVTTVSRVLNNRGYISDETRAKVYAAMDELNYQPNEVARSLSKKSTNTIGLIVPLYLFIFGVYFYFYTDFNITKINKFIFISNILFVITGISIFVIKKIYEIKNIFFFQIYEFLHISIAFCLILIAIMGLYGCYKYKY